MAPSTRPGVVRRFFRGCGYLGRGFRAWGTSPRLMLLGAIPALIVGAVYLTAIILLAINLEAIVTLIDPGDGVLDGLLRALLGAAIIGGVVVIAAVSYGAVTLAVGDPFYERISLATERRLGNAPVELEESFWRGARRGLANGLRLLALTASVGLLLFIGGFIPVLGQFGVPVVGALVGGWFLALELTGFAFDARGFRLRDRRRMLGAGRATTLGFGVLVYLLFLVPLAAIVVMPAAVAGATELARDALAAETTRPAQ
jgi:CysZ protein